MTMPVSVQTALDLVRRSRVVGDGPLDEFVRALDAADAPTPAALYARLLEDGLLTPYQANRLAAGRGDGLRVGPYLIQSYLGRGATGEVYLAEHALLRKRVAVKVLSGAADADPAARGRFVREARAAAAVSHPNIVHVFDVDVEHDPPFLVMEFVDGVSLQAAVADHGPFSPAEAAAVGAQVALGLAPVAAVGLVHRDIKPANLLIDRKGAVKILDLGIARFTSETLSRPAAPAEIVGTLDYLAPEQAVDSSAVDPRADLYALGATLYFLLAGHPPFPCADAVEKIARKQFADPLPLHDLRADVPLGLSTAVHLLLARAPADRPQTPAAAAALLEPWAAAGGDFPARLFRAGRPSTAGNDERQTDHDREVLPDTLRLRPPPAAAAQLGSTVVSEPVALTPPPLIVRPVVAAVPSQSRAVWGWAGVVFAAALLCRLVWFTGR